MSFYILYDISHFGFQIGSAFHDVSWKPCPVHYPVITQMWLKPQLNAVVGPHDVFAVSKLNKTVSTCTHETQQLGHRICYIGAPYFGIALWCALAQVVGFATHFSSHNLSHTAKQRNKTIQFWRSKLKHLTCVPATFLSNLNLLKLIRTHFFSGAPSKTLRGPRERVPRWFLCDSSGLAI